MNIQLGEFTRNTSWTDLLQTPITVGVLEDLRKWIERHGAFRARDESLERHILGGWREEERAQEKREAVDERMSAEIAGFGKFRPRIRAGPRESLFIKESFSRTLPFSLSFPYLLRPSSAVY